MVERADERTSFDVPLEASLIVIKVTVGQAMAPTTGAIQPTLAIDCGPCVSLLIPSLAAPGDGGS